MEMFEIKFKKIQLLIEEIKSAESGYAKLQLMKELVANTNTALSLLKMEE